MKYLRIKNSGIIDPRALHLVGASTKVGDDSKIGQFGSGNKYALAYLLRNGYNPRVFAGKEEVVLTLEEEVLRGHAFQVLCIDGVRTSITTEMGLQWQLWQALRELYANALDEGEATIETLATIRPENGETHFYIDMKPEVMEFLKEFGKYFSMHSRVLFECELGRILQKGPCRRP